MPTLPFAAHGDTLPVIKLDKAYKGKGEARQEIGSKVTAMQFLVARFRDLEITFRGGDFGTVVYSGTASGVEFLNLNPPTPPAK